MALLEDRIEGELAAAVAGWAAGYASKKESLAKCGGTCFNASSQEAEAGG